MGSGSSVNLTPDADSVIEPGTKVVMSEPLEVDFGLLFDEYMDQLRYPVEPIKEYVLKECSVEEHGPDDFTVKVVLDGKKLDSYGYGRGDGVDNIDLWTRVTGDRAKREIWSRPIVAPPGCYVDEVDTFKCPSTGAKTSFTSETPLRVEFWIEMAGGARLDQDIAKGILLPPLGGAMQGLGKQLVKVKPDMDATRGGGLKSVISDPFDELSTFDEFWDKYLDAARNPPSAQVKPEIIEVSDEEFHTVAVIPGGDKKLTTKFRHCKESGEIQAATFLDAELTGGKTTTIVHKEPLFVEAWGESKTGDRQAGRGAAKMLQASLEAALAPKKTGWFW
mmetsp:Transcript_47979/g.126687  ORF Transcript_47979/g.126687 Transcript_47979/m.126687 type:complete len:334 (+) Transcript_47979:109-1110(+)